MLPDSKLCPASVAEAFTNYRDQGIPPGDFIRACLENNLCEAFLRADGENRENLQHVVAWLYWEMPVNLWKSREAVNAHLARMAKERDEPPLHDVSQRWDGGLHNRPMTEHDCP